MDNFNKIMAELNIDYKRFDDKKNKNTSAVLRKSLQSLKNMASEQRKDVLNSIKVEKPVGPVPEVVPKVVPEVVPEVVHSMVPEVVPENTTTNKKKRKKVKKINSKNI